MGFANISTAQCNGLRSTLALPPSPSRPPRTAGQAVCEKGLVVTNSSSGSVPNENWLSTAAAPEGPWSDPVRLDSIFNAAQFWGLRNTNLVIDINKDGSMIGLWRRCCKGVPGTTLPRIPPLSLSLSLSLPFQLRQLLGFSISTLRRGFPPSLSGLVAPPH